jgi:two-component system, NtrC family, nitrogen regulation response regulator GlnG
MSKLLVVDDEPLICQSFHWVFATGEVEVTTAGTIEEGWRRVEADQPDVIVLDLQLPDGSGLDLFERIHKADPNRPVIFLTAHGTADTAIEAMKHGAFDYLGKPFELDQMSELLNRAFEASRQSKSSIDPPEAPPRDRIVGKSLQVREISKQIGRVAPLDVSVLILGESGTGKELVARALHDHSRQAAQVFLAINCAAIPEGLVESELFGYEPGAFTGASQRRIGRLEQADKGTLFLDEIGDMPLPVQAKILRFLQNQTFERVGGRKPITTRVRVLAATNHDLERLIAEGRFRSDLYYRLKEVTIHVPPLRDRIEDVFDLAFHFLTQFSRKSGRDIRDIDPEVLSVLRAYRWPGNVRELRSFINEAAIRTSGRTILLSSLPRDLLADFPDMPAETAGVNEVQAANVIANIEAMLTTNQKDMYHRVVGAVEKELITRVLRHTKGHLGNACECLGIDRKTLRNKMRELGLTVDKHLSNDSETTQS